MSLGFSGYFNFSEPLWSTLVQSQGFLPNRTNCKLPSRIRSLKQSEVFLDSFLRELNFGTCSFIMHYCTALRLIFKVKYLVSDVTVVYLWHALKWS